MSACYAYEAVLEKLHKACERAGRDPSEVVLLGASKTVPPDRIREFYNCGLKVFGENRVQEFMKKWESLKALDIDWHFIGRLQSNKVKYILGKVSLIHSLDRESLAREISKRATALGTEQECLIEVNVGGEDTKGGISPSELERFTEFVISLGGIRIQGLMCIPPYREDPEEVRPYFARLRELRDSLSERLGIRLSELSMGMSHDFEVAIEEGATIVRVGTALFGERA